MRRYGLHDDEWDRIKDLLPGREGDVGVIASSGSNFAVVLMFDKRFSRILPDASNQ